MAVEWFYQYQSLYLRLVAEQKITETHIATADQLPPMDHLSMEQPLENSSDLAGKSSPPSSYFCPKCGNNYSRLHSLNRHIKFECGVEPQFECPLCHKKSKHKHNLLLHMRTHQKH
ncbi:transcription factor che-1-like [Microplitis mediator]|uniref:transcription factor che-1-like n=1 Tax=Microplitis mediator TaxID=375433 RepID=UPI0025558995|nr:transcription factor che-1-like [Microplitis mediator]